MNALLFAVTALLTLTLGTVSADSSHHHDHHSHSHSSNDHDHNALAAHEHGIAQMQIVIDHQQLLMEIQTPLYNVVGFEHAPKSITQQQTYRDQMSMIRQGNLIKWNRSAACKLQNVELESPFGKHHDHHHGKQKPEGTHQDVSFEYGFNCQGAGEKVLDIQPLFKAWPNLQSLRLQWINNGKQKAVELTRNAPSTVL